MRTASVYLLALALTSDVAADSSVSPASLELATQRILGGRLELGLPLDMKTSDAGSVSGNRRGRDVARGEVEVDGMHFKLMAFETYATMGKNFRSAIAADLREQGVDVARAKIQPITLTKPLVGFEVLPKIPKSSLDANVLVYAAYVGTTDGTVQVLAFYVSNDALSYALAWTKLARRIVTSATLGDRAVDRQAGDKSVFAHIQMAVPDGWAITPQFASDMTFVGSELHQVVPLGTAAASCELQLGGVPQFPANLDPLRDVTRASGTVLGSTVEWREWGGSQGASTVASVKNVRRSAPLIIACRAPNRAELAKLRQMIETLRRVAD